ncbi:UNVERIFIED_CONTAM: hypothetical protein GTU68_021091, partial [Idotea baltica]|nr:hypothetical protein [Idotea baltica]
MLVMSEEKSVLSLMSLLSIATLLLHPTSCQGEDGRPITGGLDSLFNEIGFSPWCVSEALSRCENSKITSSLQDLQKEVKSMQKSIEEQNRSEKRPRNCADLLKQGDLESGVRTVFPFGCCEGRPVSVWCDQTTDGGGWTLIQHREDLPQRENFFRNWVEYQLGFGNVTKEFWLGLEPIHALVSETLMEIRIELNDFDGNRRWAKYDYFYIGNSADKYRLDFGEYSGDAGDSFARQKGSKFSTKDQDNDTWGKNCAQKFKGAWWYKDCHNSNLNGYQYEGHHDSFADGINWK